MYSTLLFRYNVYRWKKERHLAYPASTVKCVHNEWTTHSSYTHWSIQFGNRSDMLCARESKWEEWGEKKWIAPKTKCSADFIHIFIVCDSTNPKFIRLHKLGPFYIVCTMHLSLASCIIGCKQLTSSATCASIECRYYTPVCLSCLADGWIMDNSQYRF